MALELEPYDRAAVEGYVLEAAVLEEQLAYLARLPLAERRELRGLHPDRAPTIVAGVAILLEALRRSVWSGSRCPSKMSCMEHRSSSSVRMEPGHKTDWPFQPGSVRYYARGRGGRASNGHPASTHRFGR